MNFKLLVCKNAWYEYFEKSGEELTVKQFDDYATAIEFWPQYVKRISASDAKAVYTLDSSDNTTIMFEIRKNPKEPNVLDIVYPEALPTDTEERETEYFLESVLCAINNSTPSGSGFRGTSMRDGNAIRDRYRIKWTIAESKPDSHRYENVLFLDEGRQKIVLGDALICEELSDANAVISLRD
jgi:hypothetical protein